MDIAQRAIADEKIILNHFSVKITKTVNNGKKAAINIPKLPTDPIVLKAADFKNPKGIINKPRSCSVPNNIATEPDMELIIIEFIISFLENVLLKIKYKITRPIIVIKLSVEGCGQPQKLPYLFWENMVDKRPVTKIRPTAIWVLFKLAKNFPETKTFTIQLNSEIKTKNIKNVCLLKSKTSLVQGKNKIGKSPAKI